MFAQAFLAVPLLASVVLLYWFLLKRSSSRILEQYERLAKRFDLELTAPDVLLFGFVRPEPFLHGNYREREVSLSAPGKGLQNTRQTETVLKLSVADKGLRLQMTGSGLLSGMSQRDSGEKVRWLSGDTAFDGALDVRTNDGVRLAMLLAPEVRQALRGLLDARGASLYLGNGVLAFACSGLLADEASRIRFEDTMEVLCNFGELLEG
jgi:hypothetical protein